VASASTEDSDDRVAGDLYYMLERDLKNLASVLDLFNGGEEDERGELETLIADLARSLEHHSERLVSDLPAPGSVASRFSTERASDFTTVFPCRASGTPPHGLGDITYPEVVTLVKEMRRVDPHVAIETVQILVDGMVLWSTGEHSLSEIVSALSREFDLRLDERHMKRLCDGLVSAGFLTLDAT
jgi:hypothetical protein